MAGGSSAVELLTQADASEVAAPGKLLAPAVPFIRLCLPALATGGLLWMCYFPLAWGWLGWVALVPFLSLVKTRATGWRVYLAAWLGGLAFFVPVLQWMRVADPLMYFTWIGLAIYCSLYFPAGLALLRVLDRRTRLPLVVTVPVVWTGLEFFRAHFATGFGWYFLGHTQHDFLAIIQISDLAGAYAVTFLLAAVNALMFELLSSFCAPLSPVLRGEGLGARGLPLRKSATTLWQTAAVLLAVAASWGYGAYRLSQDKFAPGPRVALIQGNVEQGVKNDTIAISEEKRQQAVESVSDHYGRLIRLAKTMHPDLIILPETSYAEDWTEFDPAFPFEKLPIQWQTLFENDAEAKHGTRPIWQYLALLKWNEKILKEAQAVGTNVLFGLNTGIEEPDNRRHRFNSAVLVGGAGQPLGRYDKIHRVPFGEYVPMRDWIPAMNVFSPYENDYSVRSGEAFTRFPVGEYHFGVVICFEVTDAALARAYVAPGDGPQADFLLNISNDGWFKGTSEHEQHLAISRFRAVECRRTVARAVNMGISAVVDPNGRVLQPETIETLREPDTGETRVWKLSAEKDRIIAMPPAHWAEFKKIPGVLLAELPVDHRTSLYARWGDWLPWSCCGFLTAAIALAWFRPVRRPAGGAECP
ncbi:MAG: apolipoprotein N-acyltransferase [Gemmataceae bacterium]